MSMVDIGDDYETSEGNGFHPAAAVRGPGAPKGPRGPRAAPTDVEALARCLKLLSQLSGSDAAWVIDALIKKFVASKTEY